MKKILKKLKYILYIITIVIIIYLIFNFKPIHQHVNIESDGSIIVTTWIGFNKIASGGFDYSYVKWSEKTINNDIENLKKKQYKKAVILKKILKNK